MKMLKIEFQSSKDYSKPVGIACKEDPVYKVK